MDKLVIGVDNPIKSKLDIFILLLVAYSCIISLYNSAFTPSTNPVILVWDWVVEFFFYLDLILSFFQAYYDDTKNTVVTSFDDIYKHYLKGWFIIDFLAVFPFNLIFSAGVMLKLVRLARIPRLMKLLDPDRFKKVVRSMENRETEIRDILQRDIIMYVYNMLRLVIIMLLLAYGFGCINYFVSDVANTSEAKLEKNT